MSDYCEDHNNHNDKKSDKSGSEKSPKSFLSKAFKDEGLIGRYLYNLGKKDFENEKQGSKHKGGGC